MERLRHRINAEGKVLGRLATEVAVLLRGKNKIGFTLNTDLGDFVTVYNIEKVQLTGKKASQKKYYTHSFYPGGLTEISYEKMLKTHPERILELSVRTMLPNNRLRSSWLKRLTVEKGSKDKEEGK